MNKKLLAIFLAVVFMFSYVPSLVLAAESIGNVPKITVERQAAMIGGTVDVPLVISNNSGIAGAVLTIEYDEKLVLTDCKNGDSFSSLEFTKPGSYSSPCNFSWDSLDTEATEDGEILILTFSVSNEAEKNESLYVNVSYKYGDIYDADLRSINVNTKNGSVTIIDYTPGDVNDDGVVNGKDVTLIRRFIAGGYNDTIREEAANVNGDKTINGKDVTSIRRFIAGGYGVVLLPSTLPCEHDLEYHPSVASTCTESGNNEYWYCPICDSYFSDENGEHEIDPESIIIPATGHTFSEEWSYDATYHWHAATCEHSQEVSDRAPHTFDANGRCTICGATNSVNPDKPYKIEFRLFEYNENQGDSYISTQVIDNSANEVHMNFASTETFELKTIKCAGYTFLGWYTPSGTRMTEVPLGTDHDLILEARWEAIVYDITYRVYMSPVGEITNEKYLHYTVNKGLQDLPNPIINNYKFLGWYNESGNAMTHISVGTTGDLVLSAYWTSYRNLAKQSSDSEATKIIDSENGYIYFTYPLGTIENVPLYELWKIQGVEGLSQVVSVQKTVSVTEAKAEEISETITKSTVDSATWRMSQDWSETEHVDEEWAQQHGMSVEEAETILKGTTNQYSTTTSSGGATTDTTNDGTTTVDYKSQNYEHGNGAKFYAEVNGKYYAEASATATAGVDIGVANASASATAKSGFEIGGKVGGEYNQNQNTNEHTGTDTTTVHSTVHDSTTTWNNSSTSSYTEQASESRTSSQVITDVLSQTYNVGRSYIHGSSESEDKGFSTTNSNSTNSRNTITVSKSETTVTTRTYTTDGKKDGWYRGVIAGKFHVFGVVGYDIASKSYFQYTISIMDDKVEEFLDYSADGSFEDNENCALQFIIPYEIYEFVSTLTLETEGLLISTNSEDHTATVVGYNGDDTDVIIPSFISTGTVEDNNLTAYRVTGLRAGAFAGKNIESVILSRYINEIPDGAFKNCANLKQISGRVYEIGSEAFSGCTSLDSFAISGHTVCIGTNAFKGVASVKATVLEKDYAIRYVMQQHPEITDEQQINALAIELTKNIADEIMNCGADNITMDISNIIPDVRLRLNAPQMSNFVLNGGGKTFTDLRLDSKAETTKIINLKVVECTGVPLTIESETIIFDTVNVSSSSFVLLAKSQNVSIRLIKDNVLTSASGKAVVCKDPTFISEISTRATVGQLSISGNLYVCGTITGSEEITVKNGSIITISIDEFNSMIKGAFTVTFDANGGEGTVIREMYFGNSLGELPVPTRDYYHFVGWFTEPDGGTQVNESFVPAEVKDITFYAHWSVYSYTITFDATGGTSDKESIIAYYGAPIGANQLPNAERTGFVFDGWFTERDGGIEITADYVSTNAENIIAYAHWTAIPYTVNWNVGSNYTITVKRTGSPNVGATTGTLANGATVYYGDILTVNYEASTGYSLSSQGPERIEVTSNVGTDDIYATVSPNLYTYTILYRSTNGRDLGSAEETHEFGTTHVITAPAKNGYKTPASQTVVWDAESKTITFRYEPKPVDYTTYSGQLYSDPITSYSVRFEYRNRTASNVQIRVVWTSTMQEAGYNVYSQHFVATSGGASTGDVEVTGFNSWPSGGTISASSGWITVPLSTQNMTSINVHVYYYQANYYGTDMSGSLGYLDRDFSVNIPAY